VQAATVLMTRLAGAFDRAEGDVTEALVKRILTPVAKYWVTKRCTPVVREAMECLGGAGYVEESIMPRIYRESPLNAIWEGSGNVIALDVMRVAAKEPRAVEALRAELTRQAGTDERLARYVTDTFDLLAAPDDPEAQARRITERLAVAAQAALLIERAETEVAEAFLASRVAGDQGAFFGTLPPGPAVSRIAAMAVPEA